jgi:SLT domain-containing protein
VVTFAQLRDANPAMYHQSAEAWKQWADSALEHAGYLNDKVGRNITEHHWGGMSAALARGRVDDAHAAISASAKQLKTVETVLIQAGRDFEEDQHSLLDAVADAEKAGFAVSDTGAVTAPATLTQGKTDAELQTIGAQGSTFQTRINGAVYHATQIDEGVAKALDGLDPKNGGGHGGGSSGGGSDGGHGPAGWNGSYGSSGAPPVTEPSGEVADWIQQAIQIMQAQGVPVTAADAGLIATIIQYESGGNPNSINLWDSNAAAGHPSKGLMQTIDSTFNGYALPGHTNIWNPVDNIIAGTRYALHTYHSLANVPGIRGITNGTGYVGY